MKYRYGFHLNEQEFKELDSVICDELPDGEKIEVMIYVGDEAHNLFLDKCTVDILLEDRFHTGG